VINWKRTIGDRQGQSVPPAQQSEDRPWERFAQLRSLAWLVVAGAALALSWWSLFSLARSFGVPDPLAAGVSLVFDAAALICANLAHRYAMSPHSGAGPRLTMLALMAGSIYLNWQHAMMPTQDHPEGYGTAAAIMFAAPAVVGVVLFELETGWASRVARDQRGRVAPSLPVIGRWGWIFHPVRSVVTIWKVTAAHGNAVRAVELDRWVKVVTSVRVDQDQDADQRSDEPSALPAGQEQPELTSGDELTTSPEQDAQDISEAPESPAETTGRLPRLDDNDTRTILDLMSTDAERVRFAMNAVGNSPADVIAFLRSYGQDVKDATVRTNIRRALKSHKVIPLNARQSA
jgi:hypothetical protein